jgi:hypothetical protein
MLLGDGVFVESLDELSIDEPSSCADERDQMGRVHRSPAGLGGLDQLEGHGQAGGPRAWPLGDLGAMPHGGEGAFDGVGRAQVDPVLGREIVEGQQLIDVVGDLGDGLAEPISPSVPSSRPAAPTSVAPRAR